MSFVAERSWQPHCSSSRPERASELVLHINVEINF
jgi:hypothetical protein